MAKPSFILIYNWRDTKHKYAGGAEVYIHELAKRWVKMGCNVTLFCGNDKHCPRYEIVDGVRIIRRGGFYLVYVWAFFYYLFKFRGKFDVILDCQNGIPFFTPIYVRDPRVKIFSLMFHVHQEVFRESLLPPLALFATFLEQKLMPLVYRYTQFFTISESSKKDILAMGLGTTGIKVITPGVDAAFMVPGKKSTIPLVLYLGRLKKYKRVDVFLKTIPLILEKVPDARFVVAGDGEEMDCLRDLASKLGVQKVVTFTGRVSEKKKRELYQLAWVFVNPSITEGWSLTNIEASACGTVVVASNVPGNRDSVLKDTTGFLVKYKKEEAFSEHIIKLIKDCNLRHSMELASIKWASTLHWDSSARLALEAIG